jgi:hypothetical protein
MSCRLSAVVSGWLTICMSVIASGATIVPISYNVPEDGNVSLAVYDGSGRLVRTVLCADRQAKGQHTLQWDGLDEKGKPLLAGEYRWKLLVTEGLKAQYLLTLGTNPTPAWDTWPGNHGGASAVTVDQAGLTIAGGCGEGDPLLIKQSMDGKRLWSVDHWLDAWMGGYSLATDGGKLFMLQQNGVIQRFDASTGKHEARWDVIWALADREKGKDTHLTMDLAARGGQIVVSYAGHDATRWISRAPGDMTVNDTYLESLLRPGNWGQAVLEP